MFAILTPCIIYKTFECKLTQNLVFFVGDLYVYVENAPVVSQDCFSFSLFNTRINICWQV